VLGGSGAVDEFVHAFVAVHAALDDVDDGFIAEEIAAFGVSDVAGVEEEQGIGGTGVDVQCAGLVSVTVPATYSSRVTEFISELENLSVEADRPARVVINERTGTIVLGKDVRVSPVAILHGNLSVEIQTVMQVSQPNPLTGGNTEVIPQTTVSAKEEKARNVVLKQGATVEELVRALASIGSTPRDVIAILQNLRTAGALEAEIEVI